MLLRAWIVAISAVGLLAPAAAHADGKRECGDRGSFATLEVVGLTESQQLICFREDRPSHARDIAVVTGLLDSEKLAGIDYRPSNGVLYGLGSKGGIYSIHPVTAVATRVSVLVAPGTTTPVPLVGASFGVDFNPVPDRLRVVSDTGQNLRINVETGETNVDTPLSVAPAPGPALGVTAVAYTNNDANPATLTVLYDIDTASDRLHLQLPPNAGALNPIGPLGVESGAAASLDVYTDLNSAGSAQRTKALAALPVDGRIRFYAVDLNTGDTRLRGTFSNRDRVIGIAVPPGQRH